MFVMTMDQRGSRRTGDLVEPLLARLAPLTDTPGVVRAFARTVGDEDEIPRRARITGHGPRWA